MKINIAISLTDASGRPFPTTGFLNVYRRSDGSLVTGKKAYSTSSEADTRSRPATGWTKIGVVRVEEYLAGLNEATRKAAIAACDARLAILLGIPFMDQTITPAADEAALAVKPKAKKPAAKAKTKAKTKPVSKPKAKVKAKTKAKTRTRR